ncbi:RNA-directed DNA polymerase, eukaryota, reverse transcriptase zinc-binding domain protein [Tanacetum coccineum]
MIHGIMKEGVWISDPSQIKEEFVNFIKEKFKNHDSNVDFPSFANSSGLCALDRDSLVTPVSLDEVENAVWDCGCSKAPCPDGFSFAFVKKYYDYIKVDILEYVNIFLDTGIGVSDVDVSSMASNSGCASGSFPFTYLGLPIGSNMSFKIELAVLKLLTSPFSKSGLGGCYSTRMRSGLKLSKLYMVRNVALMVASITIYRLYRLESKKYCLIIDRFDHGQWRWNRSRTNLGAQNSADLLDMLGEISSAEINGVEDTCVWSLGTDGSFSIKDARCVIDSKILASLAPSTVWDKNIPRKVNIFIWRLILGRLPHRLNLSSRGIDIQAISCPSCNGNVESSNHIFLSVILPRTFGCLFVNGVIFLFLLLLRMSIGNVGLLRGGWLKRSLGAYLLFFLLLFDGL